jgi:hypothetical protein
VKEHDHEPVRGLPERLPPGERLIWQGAPAWRALARHALHVRAIGVYFAALVVWREAQLLAAGVPAMELVHAGLWIGAGGLCVVVLLTGMAWLISRTTVYTITNRRIVIRFGIALSMTVNLPFRGIASAALKCHSDGSGDIPVVLTPEQRVSYIIMWPHVRPLRFARVQPMLRSIPAAATVAQALSRALAADAAQPAQPAPVEAPAGHRPVPAGAAAAL